MSGMKMEKEEEMKNKLKEQSSNEEVQMKLATERLRQLDKKSKEHEKELKDFQRKDAENREQITVLREQNTKLQADLNDRESTLKVIKQKRDEQANQIDKLKEQKNTQDHARSSQDANEKQELKDKVYQLERANATLRSDKAKEYPFLLLHLT